jgi:hypothetical protein
MKNFLTFLSALWHDERGEVVIEDESAKETSEGTEDPPEEKPITAADIEKLEAKWKAESDARVAEANENTRHWYDEYTKATKGSKPAKAEEPPEDDDKAVAAFLDDVNAHGFKAIDAHMKRRGYISKDEAAKLIQDEARGLMMNAKLQENYPELADKTSDLFKQTAEEYSNLENSGIPKSHRTALAVERAELTLRRQGKWKDPEDEEERRRHIDSQNGSKGSRKTHESEPVTLTAREQSWAKEWGLAPEDVLKSKKEIEAAARTKK